MTSSFMMSLEIVTNIRWRHMTEIALVFIICNEKWSMRIDELKESTKKKCL